MHNKDADLPSGWNNELLDFYKYGGPGIKYGGQGKLPPMLKDIITHYFFLLGENPNLLAEEIPSNYEERCLDDLTFIPPPDDFVFPDWATPFEADGSDEVSRFSSGRSSSSVNASPDHFTSSRASLSEGRIVVRLTRTRAGTQPGAVPPSSPPTTAREPEPEPAVSPERCIGTPPYHVWSSPPPPPRKRARASTPQSPPPSPHLQPQLQHHRQAQH